MAAAKKAAPKPASKPSKQGGLPPWLTPGGPGAKKAAPTKMGQKKKASCSTEQGMVATYAIKRNGRTVKKVTGTVDVAYQAAKNWARRSIRKRVPLSLRVDCGVSYDSATSEFGYRITRM